MLGNYVQLDDGTQFAFSETREDGTVRVAVKREKLDRRFRRWSPDILLLNGY